MAGGRGPTDDFASDARVTAVDRKVMEPVSGSDCIVVIYSSRAALFGRRIELAGGVVKIGRGAENDVVIDGDDVVSRVHASIVRRADNYWLFDMKSTNGSFVNDARIDKMRQLCNGDRIKIGSTIFKFLSGKDVESLYHEEIYRLSVVDNLTEAYVRRYFMDQLEQAVGRARRDKSPLSILMLDVDHFKKVNDTFGHLAGDYVLRELSAVVRRETTPEQTFARYGGEEFSLLLPDWPSTQARVLAEKLRRQIAEFPFSFADQSIPVTISLGCTELAGHDATALSLVERADALLYEAKRAGRNRTHT